jgi:hypothetical protein
VTAAAAGLIACDRKPKSHEQRSSAWPWGEWGFADVYPAGNGYAYVLARGRLFFLAGDEVRELAFPDDIKATARTDLAAPPLPPGFVLDPPRR